MKLLVTIFLLAGSVGASRDGLDFEQALSVATFTCLKNNGISFVIPRLYRSLGSVDTNGYTSVKNAHSAGIQTVDGYIFPCLASHCSSAAEQVKTTLDTLKSHGTTISTLWLDIERFAWPASHATNRAFIEAMVAEAKAYNQPVGIYSNYYNWEDIVGLDYTAQSALPLWWADYNNHKDFTGYTAFGGWKTPEIHQWHDTTSGQCGVSADLNHIP